MTINGQEEAAGIQPVADARALVLDAFARARQAGKAAWDVMTTAVLKNRLLDLTERRFREADYGARDMMAFVRSMPDLLEVTPTESGPPIVRLQDKALVDEPTTQSGASPGVRLPAPENDRLRPDIWRAAMAWNEGSAFVLDAGRLRPRGGDDEGLPTFSPVTEADFLAWKENFIQRELEQADASSTQLLESWRGVAAPSRILGKELQDGWMTYLREQVAGRVEQWYRTHGLPMPDDLYVPAPPTVPPGAEGSAHPTGGDERRLKEYVLRCIHAMTVEELRALPIPAAVAARVWHG